MQKNISQTVKINDSLSAFENSIFEIHLLKEKVENLFA